MKTIWTLLGLVPFISILTVSIFANIAAASKQRYPKLRQVLAHPENQVGKEDRRRVDKQSSGPSGLEQVFFPLEFTAKLYSHHLINNIFWWNNWDVDFSGCYFESFTNNHPLCRKTKTWFFCLCFCENTKTKNEQTIKCRATVPILLNISAVVLHVCCSSFTFS